MTQVLFFLLKECLRKSERLGMNEDEEAFIVDNLCIKRYFIAEFCVILPWKSGCPIQSTNSALLCFVVVVVRDGREADHGSQTGKFQIVTNTVRRERERESKRKRKKERDLTIKFKKLAYKDR